MQTVVETLLTDLKNKSSMIVVLVILILQVALSAQPMPPSDDDDDDFLAPPQGMMRNGKDQRHGVRNRSLKNFSWDTANKNLMPLIKNENPLLHQFILANKDKGNALSKRIARSVAIMSQGQQKHPDNFKEMFKLALEDLETERLTVLYHQATSEAQKNEYKSLIKAKLTEAFDQKEKIRAEIIGRLEDHLKKQKSELQKRQNKKSKIVEKRLEKMLDDDSEDLNW